MFVPLLWQATSVAILVLGGQRGACVYLYPACSRLNTSATVILSTINQGSSVDADALMAASQRITEDDYEGGSEGG